MPYDFIRCSFSCSEEIRSCFLLILMKTACSDDELVCAFCCIQLRCCSNPLIRICLSHLSVFMFCSLSVSSLCFYLMKTACSNQEDVCSSCFLPFKESGLAGYSIKVFYYTWRKLSVSIHLNGCWRPPQKYLIWSLLNTKLSLGQQHFKRFMYHLGTKMYTSSTNMCI